jgi:hypothetical protein
VINKNPSVVTLAAPNTRTPAQSLNRVILQKFVCVLSHTFFRYRGRRFGSSLHLYLLSLPGLPLRSGLLPLLLLNVRCDLALPFLSLLLSLDCGSLCCRVGLCDCPLLCSCKLRGFRRKRLRTTKDSGT